MSSLLTNTSAMVALQTLKQTNKGMATIQNQISTGMKVATAKDNASTWAIASTMRSDVGGFKQVKESLDTASAAVNVARTGAETVTKLLTTMKEKIVQAQSPSADRDKIQADVNELRNQIASVVGTAQFNGLNFLNGATDPVNFLASLDRDAAGSVSSGTITVQRQDLRATGLTLDDTSRVVLAAAGADSENTTATIDTVAAGDVFRLTVGQKTFEVTATADDDGNSIANKLAAGLGFGTVDQNVITFANTLVADTSSMTWEASTEAGELGGLATLQIIDVSTAEGAGAALASIEGLIQTAIDASAALGSAQQRIEIQQDFMGKLIDSMNTGIGAMVDADMEEASARLQALQVQQQLGIQALSIANQSPQSILALFR